MKITKSYLKQVIKEELEKINEDEVSTSVLGTMGGRAQRGMAGAIFAKIRNIPMSPIRDEIVKKIGELAYLENKRFIDQYPQLFQELKTLATQGKLKQDIVQTIETYAKTYPMRAAK